MSALIVLVTLPLIPVFGILVGLATQDRAQVAVAGAGVAVRALPRRDARAADAGRVPPGRRPSRRRSARSPTGTAGGPCRPCRSRSPPRRCSSWSPRCRSRWSRSPSASGSRTATSTSRPRWSCCCSPRRRTGRCAGSGMEFHAAAEGVATFEAASELTDADDATPHRRPGRAGARPRVGAAARPRRTRARRRQPGRPRPRRARRHRPVRLRQVDAARGARRAARADLRHRARTRPATGSPGCRSDRSSSPGRSPTTCGSRHRTRPTSQLRAALAPGRAAGRARRPGSARTGRRCRPASGPAWRWPGWCSRTGPTCCSTSRPPTSTRTPSGSSPRPSASSADAARSSSSRTARRWSRSPTGCVDAAGARAGGAGAADVASPPGRRPPDEPVDERRARAGAADRARRPGVGVRGRAHGHRGLADRARRRTSRAILTLLVAIVAVRTFGIARPVLRYAERLRSHDVVLRHARRSAGSRCTTPSYRSRPARSAAGAATCSPRSSTTSTACWTASCGCGCRCAGSRSRRRSPPVFAGVRCAGRRCRSCWPCAGAGGRPTRSPGPARLAPSGRRGRHPGAALGGRRRGDPDRQRAGHVAGRGACGRPRSTRLSADLGRHTVAAATWLATGRALVLRLLGSRRRARPRCCWPARCPGRCSRCWCCCRSRSARSARRLADAGALAARTRAAEDRLAALAARPPAVADPDRRCPRRPAPTLAVDGVAAAWDGREVLRDLDLTARRGRAGRRRRSDRVRARARSRRCCCASSTRSAAQVDSGRPARCRTSRSTTYDAPSGWSTTTRTSSPRRWGRTSGWPARAPPTWRSRRRCARPGWARWLDALPDGLDSWLGDGHADVSGGERARIAIARSLLADQPVLVLDEPAAHLDGATADALAAEVLDSGDGRTVVWITHADAGLDRVDRVIDLGTGRTVPMADDKIRVYLLDDHEVVRQGLRALLESAGDIEVVGESGTAEEAAARIPALRPHVAVLDARLPGRLRDRGVPHRARGRPDDPGADPDVVRRRRGAVRGDHGRRGRLRPQGDQGHRPGRRRCARWRPACP